MLITHVDQPDMHEELSEKYFGHCFDVNVDRLPFRRWRSCLIKRIQHHTAPSRSYEGVGWDGSAVCVHQGHRLLVWRWNVDNEVEDVIVRRRCTWNEQENILLNDTTDKLDI